MTMPSDPTKQSGPLARVGQNDSFAGFTRLWQVTFGVLLTAVVGWAAFDVGGVLHAVQKNQDAIIAVADRVTRLEDNAANSTNSSHEFREWTIGRVNDLTSQMNGDGQRINDLDRAQGKLTGRVLCLENHVRCPQ